jgi:hypothetical protein
MIACTRCGRWHGDAERASGKNLSCTEVKHFRSRVRNEHKQLYRHLPQITTDDSEHWVWFKCKHKLQDMVLLQISW